MTRSATAEEGVACLMRGLPVLKYGRQGKPHKTILRLSEDEAYLLWDASGIAAKLVKRGRKERRRIFLADVLEILVGQESMVFHRIKEAGAAEHVSLTLLLMPALPDPPSSDAAEPCAPLKREDRATLDFSCLDEEQFGLCVAALRALVEEAADHTNAIGDGDDDDDDAAEELGAMAFSPRGRGTRTPPPTKAPPPPPPDAPSDLPPPPPPPVNADRRYSVEPTPLSPGGTLPPPPPPPDGTPAGSQSPPKPKTKSRWSKAGKPPPPPPPPPPMSPPPKQAPPVPDSEGPSSADAGGTPPLTQPPPGLAKDHQFYELLGVGYDASDSELRKSYRRLAIRYHPDKQTDESAVDAAADMFRAVNHAYKARAAPGPASRRARLLGAWSHLGRISQVLSDPRKRETYNEVITLLWQLATE